MSLVIDDLLVVPGIATRTVSLLAVFGRAWSEPPGATEAA